MNNVLWGVPRIHVKLLDLGIKVSGTTVAKYMIRRHRHGARSSAPMHLSSSVERHLR
jgi:hypothetical protein